MIGELFNMYMDLLSCNILEKKDKYRTGDLGICLCALLCAGQGEGGLAVYGHMTMFSIGSLVGQVLCIHGIFRWERL